MMLVLLKVGKISLGKVSFEEVHFAKEEEEAEALKRLGDWREWRGKLVTSRAGKFPKRM